VTFDKLVLEPRIGNILDRPRGVDVVTGWRASRAAVAVAVRPAAEAAAEVGAAVAVAAHPAAGAAPVVARLAGAAADP
jgi:hypothetical protein